MQTVIIKRANGNIENFNIPNHKLNFWAKLFRDDNTISAISVSDSFGSAVYTVAWPGRIYSCVRLDR